LLTPLAVFPSVARGKISVPRAVTPSYTRAYHVAFSGGPCSTYLVLHSRDVSPAVSPSISSGRCRHPASMFRSLRRRDVRAPEPAGNLKFLKNEI
ncbi:unnamed protein product, partial [Staurois parvus]